MKTKLLLTLLAFVLMSSTCEPDTVRQYPDCNCEVTYYLYVPNVGQPLGVYEPQFSEPIDFDCINEPYGFYYEVNNINYNYAKVECE